MSKEFLKGFGPGVFIKLCETHSKVIRVELRTEH